MENQADSKKTILNYGLYTGLVSIFITVILYALGKSANPGIIIGIISFILPLVVLVLGIKKFKDSNSALMAWGQGVKVGVGIALIWGILTLGFQLLLENVIDPSLIEQKLEVARVQLENFGMSQEIIDQQIEEARNQNPLLSSVYGLIFFAFIGFVVSAIAAAIMKKTPQQDY